MARLAILLFKAEGTAKLVGKNRISYNYPDLFQGPGWTLGDNREDLHNVYNPPKTLLWYNIELQKYADFVNTH